MNNTIELTEKQQRILDLIVEWEKKHGRYPRQADIVPATGLTREGLAIHIDALRKKGAVELVKTEEKRIKYIYPKLLIPTTK